jgi:hypothetical protein
MGEGRKGNTLIRGNPEDKGGSTVEQSQTEREPESPDPPDRSERRPDAPEPVPGVTPLDDVAPDERDLEPAGVMPGAGPDRDPHPEDAVEGSEEPDPAAEGAAEERAPNESDPDRG